MNLKTHCLSELALPAHMVQQIYDCAGDMTQDRARLMVRKLAMSHERLRAELDGLQVMYDELDRKVQHGCAGANCELCDKGKK